MPNIRRQQSPSLHLILEILVEEDGVPRRLVELVGLQAAAPVQVHGGVVGQALQRELAVLVLLREPLHVGHQRQPHAHPPVLGHGGEVVHVQQVATGEGGETVGIAKIVVRMIVSVCVIHGMQ